MGRVREVSSDGSRGVRHALRRARLRGCRAPLRATGSGSLFVVTILTTIADLPGSRTPLAGYQLSLPAQLEGKAGHLLVAVQGFEELPPAEKTRRTRKLASHQFERVVGAMRELHAEPVRLSAIASLIGLSRWQFSRSFHETAGVTFSHYLMQLRVGAAMRLMLETDKSLCDVAITCGFGDQSNFSRLFLRSCGITPKKWRQLCRA
jgi:AraC-like DNA-binding protein